MLNQKCLLLGKAIAGRCLGRWKAVGNNWFYCDQRVLTELFFWIWVYRQTKWPVTARCTCVFSWCEFVSIQQLWKSVLLLAFCLYKEQLGCIVWKLVLRTWSGERMLTIHKCSVKFQSCTPAEVQGSLSECSKCKWSPVTACLVSLHVISKYLRYGLCLIVLHWDLYLTTEASAVLTGVSE